MVSAVIFLLAFFIVQSLALDSSSWISSTLTAQKQADTTTLPTTVSGNGNIDCDMEDAHNCSVPTNYGTASADGIARINSSSKFIPVITYIDGQQHFFPVPNSDMAISYYSGGAVYGLNAAFNYNFIASTTKTGNTYTITKPPDGKLSDRAKHLLAADTASTSFSENGRWMVVSIPNNAVARVNLETFEVLPFAPGFNYTIGLDPSVKTAITNDGRYAAVSSNNFSTFKIYDLSTCAAVPDTITSPVACQSRDLRVFMQGAVPGFSFIQQARFMDDNNLATYAVYKSGTANKIARFIISNNNSTHQLDLLGLGDSYISGEGAFNYVGGTDTQTNQCHLSSLAYPYLIGKDLDYNSYHSVACSGAVTNDITDTGDDYIGQATDKVKRSDRTQTQIDSMLASFSPGYIAQLEFVKTYQPQIVTLSAGGDDMGFSKIVQTCVTPSITNGTCYSTYEDRLALVRQIENTVYPRLIQTYQQIKAAGPPDMRVYVIGYPQIAKPGGDCGLNVHLNADEVLFSQELINYLDAVVQDAAAKTGVYYVDTQDALYGFRLCEAGPGAVAMNGLTAGNDFPDKLGGPIGRESYHPNTTGYQLLENNILSATHNLTNSMPTPDLSVVLPNESSLEILNVLHTGQTINIPDYAPTIAPDLAYVQMPFSVSISGSQAALPLGTTLQAELHSTPISLGNFKTDSSGNLSTQITIPSNTPAGYHTLHFYGTNLDGQTVDIYKYIYVATSADDLDGNGVLDVSQKCVGVEAAGQDFDKDGIDDACDADITEPPTSPISSNLQNDTNGSSPSENDSPSQDALDSSSTKINSGDSQSIIPVQKLQGVGGLVPADIDSSEILTTNSLAIRQPASAVLSDVNEKPLPQYLNHPGPRVVTKSVIIGFTMVLVGIAGLLYRRCRN